MVKVGKICHKCQWFGSYTKSCSYCDLNKKSRLWDKDGNKIDPAYCDKFVEGEPRLDNSQWGKKGVITLNERGTV